MLDVALEFVRDELNGYLLRRSGSDFGQAKPGRIVDDTGKWAIEEDHIGVSLINVDEERALKTQTPEITRVNGRQVLLEPELKLNLYALFAAYFKDYKQALQQLSYVLTFFQSHPVFTPDRNPGLDPRIARLGAELLSLNYEQLNQIWAYIGGKYLPSAIYRLRLVVLQDTEPSGVGEPVTEVRGALGIP